MTLGERVLILRRRLKMSQSMLARTASVDTTTIARLEQGRVRDLSGDTIVRMAKALQVSADVLLGMVDMDEDEDEVSQSVGTGV